MPPKKIPDTPKHRSLPKKKISSPEEGWTEPEKPVKRKIVKRRSSSASPKRGRSPSKKTKSSKRPSSTTSSSSKRKSSSSKRNTSSSKRKSSPKKSPRKDTVEFSRFAPYFVRPQVKRRAKAKAAGKTKYVQVDADDAGMPIYADIGEEQLIAKWLAANTEERKKMVIGETEEGEPIYGDALDEDSDSEGEASEDETLERKRTRMLAKLRKLLPYEEDIEYEYGMVDLYTDGGLELAQQLGLPLKEERLLPRKVRRYVVDAERGPPKEVFKMTKGPGGLLYDLKGNYKIKKLGSDFVKDEEELDLEEQAQAPEKNRTAYAHFAHERREYISQNEPSLASSEISKKIKEEWSALDEEEKAVYTTTAEEDARRYKKQKKRYDATKRKVYPKPEARTPYDEDEEKASRRADFLAANANKYNKKFPKHTKISFVSREGKKEQGFVVDFAKPGFVVRTNTGTEHKLKYTNPSIKILKKKREEPEDGYRKNPASLQIEDLYKTRVDKAITKDSLRAHIIRTYTDVMQELGVTGPQVEKQIAKFEQAVFKKVAAKAVGSPGATAYAYLINVLMPLVFLEGSLAEHAKIFRAKISNGSYEFGMLANANMAIYLPEFAMSESFSKNVKTGKKGQHGTAMDVAGEVISELLHIHIENVLELYIRVLDPTRQKKMKMGVNTAHIIEPLVELLEEPASVCQRQTQTGMRQKVDSNNKLVYETQGSGKNKRKVPVYEKIPDGDIVMCFDDRRKKFSCQSVNDVVEAIRYADRMSKGDIIIYPRNKATGELYPDDFIDRFRETYAKEIGGFSTPKEPSPKPYTPSPVLEKPRVTAKAPRKPLPPRHKRNSSPSRKVKEISTLGLVGRHLDVISLFTDVIDVPLKSGQTLQIPITHNLKNSDINVVVVSFDISEDVEEIKSVVEKAKKVRSKADLYIIGVGSAGESKKKSIRKEISKVLDERPLVPKHIFFSEDDEEHLMDALFNVVVDVEGVDISDGKTKKRGKVDSKTYDPKRVDENYVPYFDGQVWIYSKEEEIKSEKARKARIEKITLKAGQKAIGKKTVRTKDAKSKKIVRKASPSY